MKIRKGDTVKVMSGKDKGKVGQVVRVVAKKSTVVVKGVNLYVKHVKRDVNPDGKVMLSKPISASNVMLVCPHCGKATRVGCNFDSQNKKWRKCKKCGNLIDKTVKAKEDDQGEGKNKSVNKVNK